MKKLFLMIPAVCLLLFMSCNQGSTQGSTDPEPEGPKAITLNEVDLSFYNEIINGLVETVKSEALPAAQVLEGITHINNTLENSNAGFRIYDKKSGTDIATGTTADELKKRLIPIAP